MQSSTNPVSPSEGISFGKWVCRGIAIGAGLAVVKLIVWLIAFITGTNWLHILVTGYPVQVFEPFMKPAQVSKIPVDPAPTPRRDFDNPPIE